MAMKRKVRRKTRRKAPSVRKIGGGPVMVGGAQSAAETEANMMVAGVMAQNNKTSRTSAPMVHRDTGTVTPRTAPGAGPARAPKTAEHAVNSMGAGRSLAATERAQFEAKFDTDLSSVRVHEGAAADRATRALDARAFAFGSDIALSHDARDPETLAHEVAHVVSVDEPYLMRDIVREPPGREDEPEPLTEAEAVEATTYNRDRFNQTSTEGILDIMGTAGRTEFETDHIPEIQGWQADFRLPTDGKIGLRTTEPVGQEMIAEGMRDPVIQFIIDAHNFSLRNVSRIAFHDEAPTNAAGQTVAARTIPIWGGRSEIRVFRPVFRRGWRSIVHSVRHEIEHANQVASMAEPADLARALPLMEFQAESVEILSRGMLLEGLRGLFGDGNLNSPADAPRALQSWHAMSDAERRAEWDRFRRVRRELQRRFDGSPRRSRTSYQAVMDAYNAVTAP